MPHWLTLCRLRIYVTGVTPFGCAFWLLIAVIYVYGGPVPGSYDAFWFTPVLTPVTFAHPWLVTVTVAVAVYVCYHVYGIYAFVVFTVYVVGYL